MFVDSHCHLDFPGLSERLDEVKDHMAAAQVRGALVIATTLEGFEAVHAIAMSDARFWASVGVHPDNEDVQEPTVDDLLQRAARPKVIAIGETGLDYYRLGERTVTDMAWQRERFAQHIQASLSCDKPLVIHTRAASDDTLSILRAVGEGRARSVFHCFTETLAVARAALDLGAYVSMSGIVTFRNAADLREVARFVPDDRLLIETDSPYLAPVPKRGKTNEPAFVAHVAACIAQERGVTVEALGALTTRNFETLFGVTVP